jgi:hypothetical protein
MASRDWPAARATRGWLAGDLLYRPAAAKVIERLRRRRSAHAADQRFIDARRRNG